MKQVTMIGLGPGNPELLSIMACGALERADLVIGARRLLGSLPFEWGKERRAATRGEEIAEILRNHKDWQEACVVMSGDVGLFSGAKGLREHLEEYRVNTIPGISSAQYFAAKLGRPWQDWRMASAHGVSCDLVSLLGGGRPVFLVTDHANTPAVLCQKLCAAGLGQTPVWAGQRLSYPDESITEGTAQTVAEMTFDPLSVMLAEPLARGARWPYASAGIPDDWLIRDKVPMTKQEVRAAALAKLKVKRDDLVYDIGAGTGSVSVELALLAKEGAVYAVEHNPAAVELIHKNAARFGLANLRVIEGKAPGALADLPAPDAVFIGGSGGNLPEILRVVTEKNPSARVCIACVTLETLALGVRCLNDGGFRDVDICQIQVSRARKAGGYHLMNAQNPVFLLSAAGAGSETPDSGGL